MRREILLIVLSVAGLSCAEPAGPDFPNVRGDYNAEWFVEQREQSTNALVTAVTCSGSLTISSQELSWDEVRTQVRGSYIIQQSSSCRQLAGDVRGDVRPDGGATLTIDGAEFPSSGCFRSGGEFYYTGVYAQRRLTIERLSTLSCSGRLQQLRTRVIATKR